MLNIKVTLQKTVLKDANGKPIILASTNHSLAGMGGYLSNEENNSRVKKE